MKLTDLDQRVILPVVDGSRGGMRYEIQISIGELLKRTLEDFEPAVVDAVPVVRCRDCRYWRQEVGPTEHWICTKHSFDGRRMHTTPDFYCKDGMVSK